MRKTIIALFLAVLLVLAPMGVLAEGNYYGRFVLSDPIIAVGTTAQDAQTLSFEGLSLDLTAFGSGADAEDVQLALLANLLSDGQTALAAKLAYAAGQATAAVDGMTHGLTVDVSSMLNEAQASAESPVPFDFEKILSALDIEKLIDTFSSIEPEDGGTGTALFYNDVELSATKMIVHITEEQYAVIYEQMGNLLRALGSTDEKEISEIENAKASAEATFWTAEDGKNFRLDLSVTASDGKETVTVPMEMLLYAQDEQNIAGSFASVKDGEGVYVTFEKTPAEDAEDAGRYDAVLNIIEKGEDAGSLTFSYWPAALEDGTEQNFVVILNADGAEGSLSVNAFKGDDDSISNAVVLEMDGVSLKAMIDGQNSGDETDRAFNGNLTFECITPEIYYGGNIGVATECGASAKYEMPDFSGFELIDAASIDEEMSETLSVEGQGVLMAAVGALFANPGVQALMGANAESAE